MPPVAHFLRRILPTNMDGEAQDLTPCPQGGHVSPPVLHAFDPPSSIGTILSSFDLHKKSTHSKESSTSCKGEVLSGHRVIHVCRFLHKGQDLILLWTSSASFFLWPALSNPFAPPFHVIWLQFSQSCPKSRDWTGLPNLTWAQSRFPVTLFPARNS